MRRLVGERQQREKARKKEQDFSLCIDVEMEASILRYSSGFIPLLQVTPFRVRRHIEAFHSP